MNIYQDTISGKLYRSVGGEEITSLDFKRGDIFPLVVRFFTDGSVVELASGATGKAILKPKGKHGGAAVAGALSWTKSGTGVNTTYTFLMLLDTIEINALLNVGETDELSYTMLNFEIEYKLTTGEVMSSITVPVALNNDENKDTDSTPQQMPSPEQWLSARAVRYDVSQTLSGGINGQKSQALSNLGFPPYPDLATASAAEGHNVAFFNTTTNRIQMTV